MDSRLSLGAVLVAAADIGSHQESAGDRITELVTFSHHCQAATTSGNRKNIGKNTGTQRNQVLIGFVMHEQPLHYGQAGGSETLRW